MGEEVLIRCPICGDKQGPHAHAHCYINVKKGAWYCHYCGEHGTVKELAKEHPEIIEVANLLRLATPSATSIFPTLGATLPVLLPEQAWAKKFLHKRGLTLGETFRYRTCTSAALPFRVIFPEYIGDNISFWSARSVRNDHPKWLFPKNGTTMRKKSESVWGLEAIHQGSEIWITEGIFDAIAVKGVCVYGKVPSNIQLQMILSRDPSKIVVALDKDAEEEATRLVRRVKGVVKVDIQFPRAKDFGAYLQAGWRRIDGTQKFKKISVGGVV